MSNNCHVTCYMEAIDILIWLCQDNGQACLLVSQQLQKHVAGII